MHGYIIWHIEKGVVKVIVKPISSRFSEFRIESEFDFFQKSNIYWEFLTHINGNAHVLELF